MKRMAFNIETEADAAAIARLPEPKPKMGNLKDPAKIAEKIAEAKRDQAECAALDPHAGRVCCITVAERVEVLGGESRVQVESAVRVDMSDDDKDDAERIILRWFWDIARKNTKGHFVTYNGAAFDVPFLMRRSLLLGVRPAAIPVGKYQVRQAGFSEHLDLYQLLGDEWSCHASCSQTLGFFAREILKKEFPYPDLDQSRLCDLMQAGQSQVIRDLCEWNTVTTLELCEVVEGVYSLA